MYIEKITYFDIIDKKIKVRIIEMSDDLARGWVYDPSPKDGFIKFVGGDIDNWAEYTFRIEHIYKIERTCVKNKLK